MQTLTSDVVVEGTLRSAVIDIGAQLKSDVFTLISTIHFGLDDLIRDEIELLAEQEEKNNRLSVILETSGGYIETVERIVAVFRKHYDCVEFIIPNYAYSAGTVLALSGDEIYMDYYSVLGPIDPQFPTENGNHVPGMGYLSKYEELLERINSVPDTATESVKAELAFLLKKFDPAELFRVEQSILHSQSLLVSWLPNYKFRQWKVTRSKGKKVTDRMRSERAKKIAKALGDAKRWHSHGRGISRADLAGEDIGLMTADFGSDEELNRSVRHYYGLLSDYMARQGSRAAMHTAMRFRRIA